jgi:membrane-associated phospholipid phosphatase
MNDAIFYFFYNLAHQSIFWDKVFIFTAVYLPYLVIIAVGVFLLMHHEVFRAQNTWQIVVEKKKELSLVFVVSGFAWVVSQLLKFFIHLPRPFVKFTDISPLISESNFAFPSGHATFFAALATAIFLIHKKVGYFFMFLAFLIGISRIIVGVHFPLDILGGFVLGAVIAYFIKNV